jgi:hypothetical protein
VRAMRGVKSSCSTTTHPATSALLLYQLRSVEVSPTPAHASSTREYSRDRE